MEKTALELVIRHALRKALADHDVIATRLHELTRDRQNVSDQYTLSLERLRKLAFAVGLVNNVTCSFDLMKLRLYCDDICDKEQRLLDTLTSFIQSHVAAIRKDESEAQALAERGKQAADELRQVVRDVQSDTPYIVQKSDLIDDVDTPEVITFGVPIDEEVPL